MLAWDMITEHEGSLQVLSVMQPQSAVRGRDCIQPRFRVVLKVEEAVLLGRISQFPLQEKDLLIRQSIAGYTSPRKLCNLVDCAKRFAPLDSVLAATDEGYHIVRKEAQQVPHGLPPLWQNFFSHPKEDVL